MSRAAACLADGGLIVAPTETRYGMLVRADDAAAVQRLCRLKGRSDNAPVSVFVSDLGSIDAVAEMTPAARRLAEQFLPGPLTLILPARVEYPCPVVVDGSIGIRISALRLITELVEQVGVPLTATSANPSGRPEAETIDQVVAAFGNRVDIYLDGGPLKGPVSTVVDCRDDVVRILRQGAVAAGEVQAVLKKGSSG